MARMSISRSIGMDHKTQKGTGSVDGPWKKSTVRVDLHGRRHKAGKVREDPIGPLEPR